MEHTKFKLPAWDLCQDHTFLWQSSGGYAFPELVSVLNRTDIQNHEQLTFLSDEYTYKGCIYAYEKKQREYVCMGGIERMTWREEERQMAEHCKPLRQGTRGLQMCTKSPPKQRRVIWTKGFNIQINPGRANSICLNCFYQILSLSLLPLFQFSTESTPIRRSLLQDCLSSYLVTFTLLIPYPNLHHLLPSTIGSIWHS